MLATGEGAMGLHEGRGHRVSGAPSTNLEFYGRWRVDHMDNGTSGVVTPFKTPFEIHLCRRRTLQRGYRSAVSMSAPLLVVVMSMVSPGTTSPASSFSANGFMTARWIRRRSGRAP